MRNEVVLLFMELMKKRVARIDTETINRIAEILKTIAHPLRLSVIEQLETHESLSVKELMGYLDSEQSLVSHHLTKMKDKGILKSKRSGKNIFYRLADVHITNIFDCMSKCQLTK